MEENLQTIENQGDDNKLEFSKKDVERMMQERLKHLKKPENQIENTPQVTPQNQQVQQPQAASQQPQQSFDPSDIAAMNSHISKGMQSDPEFAQLTRSGLPVPHYRTLYITKALGEDSLPLIKEALKDPKTNQELMQHQDTGSLIAWAVKKNKEIQSAMSSPDSPNFTPKPDALNAGSTPTTIDEDSKWRSEISKKYR